MIAIFLSLAAAAIGAQASAADTAATTAATASATAPAAQSAAKPKSYCVKEALTGSRLERKVCKTRDEWLAQGWDPLNP